MAQDRKRPPALPGDVFMFILCKSERRGSVGQVNLSKILGDDVRLWFLGRGWSTARGGGLLGGCRMEQTV